MGGVDRLPALERRQEPDPDVDRPVAHREDPAVPGEGVAPAVPQVEMALDPRLVVAGRPVVPPDRHPQGVAAAPGRPQRPAEPPVGPVGDEEIAGPDGLRRAAVLPLDHRPDHEAVLEQGLESLRGRPEGRPRLDGLVGHHLVEIAAGHDVAVGRIVGMGGPLQLQRQAVGHRPEPDEAVVLLEPPVEAHLVQLADGPGRQPVTAGLLPGKALLLEKNDVVARLGQPVGRRGAGRAPAHHHDVEFPGGPGVSPEKVHPGIFPVGFHRHKRTEVTWPSWSGGHAPNFRALLR